MVFLPLEPQLAILTVCAGFWLARRQHFCPDWKLTTHCRLALFLALQADLIAEQRCRTKMKN